MTTVGYGDLYPQTTPGRAIAFIVMLVGIGFIAIVTAAVAQKVVVAGVTTEIDTVELEAEQDLRSGEAHVLGELRDLQSRLGDLEVAVRRMARGRPEA
jgi:voltage-gated potassium channel